MSREESSNGLHLIKYACIMLKGKFSALFMGTFAMVTPLALMLMLPLLFAIFLGNGWIFSIGILLFSVFVGPLQLGYIKFFNETIEGKQPKIWRVYSQIKFNTNTLRAIYMATLLLILYLVGGLLWLITAGFVIAFFSMSFFFYEKFQYGRMTVAMRECAKHMIGNRLAMFSYKLIFYLLYFMLFVVGGLCLALIYVLFAESIIISYIVCLCSVIVFVFLYTMITLYFHASNQIFFEDLLMYREKMLQKENKKKQSTSEDVSDKKETLKENQNKEDGVEDKKKEVKKTENKGAKNSRKPTSAKKQTEKKEN